METLGKNAGSTPSTHFNNLTVVASWKTLIKNLKVWKDIRAMQGRMKKISHLFNKETL